MKKILFYLLSTIFTATIVGCEDNDSCELNKSNLLTFESDTITLDTVFTKTSSSTKSFWVFNDSESGIRLSNVRLQSGNQSGFRVNVDGTALVASTGYQTSDIEIRKGDSIRVFVEVLPPKNATPDFTKLEDKLIFTHESGNVQAITLTATSINAEKMTDVVITQDTQLGGETPIVIFGSITVKEAATLTIKPGTTLYFHDSAGIDVYGKLIANGTQDKFITLRGDRLDRMFPYLPYNNLSGQWKGIHFYESSYDNEISFADIHSAYDAIVCDSSDTKKGKLMMQNTIVHNSEGYGVKLTNCAVGFFNCQFTNALSNCIYVCGGDVTINNCTIAQFYALNSSGYALLFTNTNEGISYPLTNMTVYNSIITGLKDDEILGSGDTLSTYNY
ncbi:MAG: right-handed parallel beta-helix repeat-containing protein, partial [Prevotellaceae bacterium]|nr:right-handed parallel beta-helix repeat-containing protein [Prevotellaceae bacterium]